MRLNTTAHQFAHIQAFFAARAFYGVTLMERRAAQEQSREYFILTTVG